MSFTRSLWRTLYASISDSTGSKSLPQVELLYISMSGTPFIPWGWLSGSSLTEKPVSVVKCIAFSVSQRYTE